MGSFSLFILNIQTSEKNFSFGIKVRVSLAFAQTYCDRDS